MFGHFWNVELVFKSAETYAKSQHIEDALPCSLNAFEVLADITPTSERVTSFLHHFASHDCGVAQWSAVQALSVIEKRALLFSAKLNVAAFASTRAINP